MQSSSTAATTARTVIAELALRIQYDLDREWPLEELARVSGYALHHVAREFREVLGVSPAKYVSQLRLERAANELVYHTDKRVLDIAIDAGYGSGEAFARAFKRSSGKSPSHYRREARAKHLPATSGPKPDAGPAVNEFPSGLNPSPTIGVLGPLRALSVRVSSFEERSEMDRAFSLLHAARPFDGPWQSGGLAQPWGWLDVGEVAQEFRLLRFIDDTAITASEPVLLWRLHASWYATFEFDGLAQDVGPSTSWLMWQWIPRSGLRPGYLPTIVRQESMPDDQGRQRCRIHVPIQSLVAGL